MNLKQQAEKPNLSLYWTRQTSQSAPKGNTSRFMGNQLEYQLEYWSYFSRGVIRPSEKLCSKIATAGFLLTSIFSWHPGRRPGAPPETKFPEFPVSQSSSSSSSSCMQPVDLARSTGRAAVQQWSSTTTSLCGSRSTRLVCEVLTAIALESNAII